MTRWPALAVVLSLVALPVAAETDPPRQDDGWSLFDEGARLMLRGLADELQPKLDEIERQLADLGPKIRAMGPMISDLIDVMGDAEAYHRPEQLPNGDILIRRKSPAEIDADRLVGPDGRRAEPRAVPRRDLPRQTPPVTELPRADRPKGWGGDFPPPVPGLPAPPPGTQIEL